MKLSIPSLKKLSLLFAIVLMFSCTSKKDPELMEDPISGGDAGGAADEAAQLPSDTYTDEQGAGELVIERVHFDFDRSDIRPEHYAYLEDLANYLAVNTGVIAEVEGHCDERGTNEYNLALGQRRAESVKTYLVNLGVNAEQINTITYGEEKPLDTANTPYAHRMNRRAEFVLR